MHVRRVKQKGAVLVMTAFFIVILMGISAFALDLGRLFVLKSQMQNAVDAAALAAAAELDGQDSARERARGRARTLLNHSTRYTNDDNQELLSETLLDDGDFIFYSAIDPAKVTATSDADALFVQVYLDTRNIDLFFLPVLGMINVIDAPSVAGTAAVALAGISGYVCSYPPLMMCDPFEDSTIPHDSSGIDSFEEAVTEGVIEMGDMFILKYQNKSWVPGNFAFLLPGSEEDGYEKGAKALGEAVANPVPQDCTAGPVHTSPGSVQSFPIYGMNTRFDEYGHNNFSPATNYAPSPVVIEYPNDAGWKDWDNGGERFGDGEWDAPYRELWEADPDSATDGEPGEAPAATYWVRYHERQGHGSLTPGDTTPGSSSVELLNRDGVAIAWEEATRRDVHSWEVRSGLVPCNPWGNNGLDNSGIDDDLTNCPSAPVTGYPGTYPAAGDPQSSDTTSPINGTEPIADGFPDPGHMYFTEDQGVPVSNEERRLIMVAVIPCLAQDINGSKPAVADAFVEFFVTRRATKGGGGDKIDYVGEFQELVGAGEGATQSNQVHTVIQLYE